MKDKRGMHEKMQELCDCFATTDPLREMSLLHNEADKEEGALKWVALAVLHGINDNAKKISISKDKDGKIQVVAKYRKSALPTPGAEVGDKVFEVIEGITHMDGEEGKLPLALGIRDSSLQVNLRRDRDGDCDTVTIEFPKK